MPNMIDTTKRKYVALRVIKVGPEAYRDRGEEVPEAQDWSDSVIRAMLHTGMLGEGPICDHSEELAAHSGRLATLESQMSELAGQLRQAISERDAALDERDAALDDVEELRAQVKDKPASKTKKLEAE